MIAQFFFYTAVWNIIFGCHIVWAGVTVFIFVHSQAEFILRIIRCVANFVQLCEVIVIAIDGHLDTKMKIWDLKSNQITKQLANQTYVVIKAEIIWLLITVVWNIIDTVQLRSSFAFITIWNFDEINWLGRYRTNKTFLRDTYWTGATGLLFCAKFSASL